MPEIRAFRGLRYNARRYEGVLDKLIAPPYDVLRAEDKAALLAGHDRNIVAVDLPHVPPKDAGPDEAYAAAARTLEQWRTDGTLVLDDRPAIYVYHQEYSHAGRRFVRRKFFARMRLEPFGAGTVFPHEQTFGGPKADRLKLMQATRCQLSAVFGLYRDPANRISVLLDPGTRPPDAVAPLEGVVHRLWRVEEPAIVQAVAREMTPRPVFIADGHHRYGTALNYRDTLLAERDLPMDHPARFILIGLCAMEDPGAVILPTHRVLSAFQEIPPSLVLDSLREGLDLSPLRAAPTDEDLLRPDSPHDVGVYFAPTDSYYAGRYTRRDVLPTLAPDRSPAWCRLDLAYLHRYLIDELVTAKLLGGAAPTIQYLKDVREATTAAQRGNGIAFLCRPCTMAQLCEVSEAGDLMPPKSTYFYPKLATGLVIHPLE